MGLLIAASDMFAQELHSRGKELIVLQDGMDWLEIAKKATEDRFVTYNRKKLKAVEDQDISFAEVNFLAG